MKSLKQRLKWYQRAKALPVALSLMATTLVSVEPASAKVEQTILPANKLSTSSLTASPTQQPLLGSSVYLLQIGGINLPGWLMPLII
ncbi:MAG: hypothetical protein ACRDEA_01480, partial [Microcystaceae cyanobacterium]